jgi:hypothetical protein
MNQWATSSDSCKGDQTVTRHRKESCWNIKSGNTGVATAFVRARTRRAMSSSPSHRVLCHIYIGICMHIKLTLPAWKEASSTATKYAGILWPHHSCLDTHQSLHQQNIVSFTNLLLVPSEFKGRITTLKIQRLWHTVAQHMRRQGHSNELHWPQLSLRRW